MDEICGLNHDADFAADLQRLLDAAASSGGGAAAPRETEAEMKTRIASHPRYPRLLQAYIDCQQVGAPPEVSALLDEIRRGGGAAAPGAGIAVADPELDEFMEMYCEVLVRYRSDLARTFDEATSYLNGVEAQLGELCGGSSRACPFVVSDEAGGTSDDDFIGEIEAQDGYLRDENRDLKDKLLQKYSSYLSSLRQEFSKKKKKGKLPKEARQILLDWWNSHYKWPYPTEADKNVLAESTGLDQKQINNWFINQRKRHWKPSENLQFAFMDGMPAPFYADE